MAKRKLTKVVEIDGRTLEGGGQLVRLATCLSALTGIAIKITNIRGSRSGGGGLKAQHLACVKWLAHASNAKVEGAEKGSKTLLFQPEKAHGDLSPAFKERRLFGGRQVYETRIDIETAGSTSLALQAVLPFILFSRFPSPLPVRLTITGGTNVSASPSWDYIVEVLIPALQVIGLPPISASLESRGWSHSGPANIGGFTLEIPPRSTPVLPGFSYWPLDTNNLPGLPSKIHATFIAPKSAHSLLSSALVNAIEEHFSLECVDHLTIDCEESHHAKRVYLILVAQMSPQTPNPGFVLARDWLYDQRMPHQGPDARIANQISDRVARLLAAECRSNAAVDDHLRDQLVVFQALASGTSRVFAGWKNNSDGEGNELREASLHTRTAEWVANLLLGAKFDGHGGCEGVGFGKETEREEAADDAALARVANCLRLEDTDDAPN